MMMLNYESRKKLTENIGKPLEYTETSMFGKEYKSNGTFCGCNRPSVNEVLISKGIKAREFFATITMENDLIKEVK